jgi:hypothetical protein
MAICNAAIGLVLQFAPHDKQKHRKEGLENR